MFPEELKMLPSALQERHRDHLAQFRYKGRLIGQLLCEHCFVGRFTGKKNIRGAGLGHLVTFEALCIYSTYLACKGI